MLTFSLFLRPLFQGVLEIFEIIGAVIGLAYLLLEYKANVWLWPVGVLMSLFYVVIFFHGKFYADAAIYLYYIGANIYGWWTWCRSSSGPDAEKGNVGISYMPAKMWIPIISVIVLLWWGIYLILNGFTDSIAPIGDAFTTATSVVAMWMLSRKYLEQWMLWIVVNVVSMVLYFCKGLYPTAVLYVVYVVMSVLGLLRWKRQVVNQTSQK